MNIGIDARLLGNRHGGIGRYTFEIAKNIILADRKNQYTIFYNDDCSTELDQLRQVAGLQNTKFVPVNIRHYSVAEQVRLPRMLNRYALDLVHFTNFNVPLAYRRPFVVTIHDAVHHKISGAKKSRLLHFYAYKKIINNAVKRSRLIITVSNYSKKDIAGIFQVAPEKILPIYEGTALDHAVAEDGVEKVKKKYLLRAPYFLFVGVLERKKNVVSLTRGFDEFIKQHRLDMDLVIAGKTDKHYPDIKHHALDIKNNARLVFTGYVDDGDLCALYKGAYAFVSASLHEGFGLPGVEAMKFGLPLVVSNIEVFNEIYENAAIYFNPHDVADIAEKMHLIARDEQFRAQLSQKALLRSEMFDWRVAAGQTVEAYERALLS